MRSRVRRSRRRDDGQVVITFALCLALFLFGLICTVADLSTMYAARAIAEAAAQDGSVAGASNVDLKTFIQGGPAGCNGNPTCDVVLNASAATSACDNVATLEATVYSSFLSVNTISCSPSNHTMYTRVQLKVKLPVSFAGISQPLVTGTYHSAAQVGTTVPAPE